MKVKKEADREHNVYGYRHKLGELRGKKRAGESGSSVAEAVTPYIYTILT